MMGGAADALIEIKCPINVMCLNRPHTIPSPVPSRGKIHSRKPALVPVAGERWSREMYLHRSAPFRWCCPGQ